MRYVPTTFCLFLFLQLDAQLYDNMWLFKNANSLFHIDFREEPPFIIQKDDYFTVHVAKSVFCTKEGDLLFYTNCIQINNQIDSLLENGDSLNPGYYANQNHIRAFNAGFFLLDPGDSTRCYFIHMYPEHFPGVPPIPIKVYYTLIDMSANNGLGKVLEKNVPILTGGLNLNYNHAGAARHANGRDWWIILPNRMEPKYYRMLLTREGFSVLDTQEIGFKVPTTNPKLYLGYNLFSPDGSKYAEFEYETGTVQFYDFDRCTGLLSNPILVDVLPSNPLAEIYDAGIAFSPSGKRFYLCYGNEAGSSIVQYDMESEDIQNSAQDILYCPTGTTYSCEFSKPLLAPNGKIYITALVDTFAHHIIHQPDKLGQACHLEVGGLVFPAKYPQTEPAYFPNYRLGPIDGSICDTLGLDNHPVAGFNWEIADTLTPLLVEFSDNSFYEPTVWFWDFGDGTSGTEENPEHLYAASGTYQVCQTVSNQYDSDTVCKLVTVVMGTSPVRGADEANFYKIFPNPAKEEISLSLETPGSGILTLYDPTGRHIRQWELQSGQAVQIFSLKDAAEGIYFWQLRMDGNRWETGKLFITK